MKTLIQNATIINEGNRFKGSVAIVDGRISNIYSENDLITEEFDSIIDATGKWLIPGVIDDQVHFRDPGLTHKGDIFTESRAAIAGGVTSYMEMPNTIPQATTHSILEEKYRHASEVSLANYSFYLGATNNNLDEVLKSDPTKICGLKVFMGSSTGNMLVDDNTMLAELFRHSPLLIATHCEDEATIQANKKKIRAQYGEQPPVSVHPLIRSAEACYRSSSKAVELAARYNTRLHVLHLSTAREMELFEAGAPATKRITAEVCVHHLWFTDTDYDAYGTRIKWNPAIKTAADRDALRQALLNNKIDVVATDHAPHTKEEKDNTYFNAPSGGPLVQHSLIVMLEQCKQGWISPEQVVKKMCHAPADLFRIVERGYIRKGYWADLVLVDPNDEQKVTTDTLLYKCGWSPFEGQHFSHRVTHTFVNGNLVFENGKILDTTQGKRLVFDR